VDSQLNDIGLVETWNDAGSQPNGVDFQLNDIGLVGTWNTIDPCLNWTGVGSQLGVVDSHLNIDLLSNNNSFTTGSRTSAPFYQQ